MDSGNTGHCRSYLSKSERQREKAMESPGFADLRDAAGGAENVAAYRAGRGGGGGLEGPEAMPGTPIATGM
ncbi:hypothetical protein [Micromonospora craniellae]|uniref:Uncharacterized protein n=1 Tax=Micromonospora craniellae TaxID=2294034 RepID=A0A372FUB0_9ACTN|nr:hypothetical protein [Micromonospora craniellae]QOC92478.1 hypothetical protein ID554_01395 [Micromonospora craniellae]RFS44288.1 hypothetical protein D0Q02_23175 [Micromonospora craniellae]